ncbi:MAG: hypothetical protein WC360_01080, partial [Opitutales bacterium]
RTRSLRNFALWSAPLTGAALMLGAWAGGAIGMSVGYAIVQNLIMALRLVQTGRSTVLTPALIWAALRGPLALGLLLTLAFGAGGQLVPGMGSTAQLGAALLAGALCCGLLLAVSKRARLELSGIISDIRGATAHKS